MSTDKQRERARNYAVGMALTQYLPDNFYGMEQEEQDNFLTDNVIELYAYHEAKDLWEIIEDYSSALLIFHSLEELYR